MTTPNDAPRHAALLAGRWLEATPDTPTEAIHNPYDGTLIGTVRRASPAELEQAIAAAVQAAPTMAALPTHERARILRDVSEALRAHSEEFAHLIAREAAKPITQARAEVQRSIFTFAQAAAEATRPTGEVIALDATPAGEGRQGIVRRFPVGPVAAITPFNFPLNLVAHKLAPAIAAGCPVVLKPAPQTPITALRLAQVLVEAGLPAGGLSVLPLATDDAAPLVTDERFKLLTFTGSPGVGWWMKANAGRKRVALELGGNAGVLIHHDANLAHAVARTVAGGFGYAGQSCISVQRIFVHQAVYEPFLAQLVPAVRALRLGNPLDEASDLSVLINRQAAERVQTWLDEARTLGATVLTGGDVQGSAVEPTVLADVPPSARVSCAEVFAPVVTVQPYAEAEAALAAVNASDFGLQAGLFTNDQALTWRAFAALEVGGLLINEVPTWRVDHMPYGGVKQSGLGREGLRDAIADMTEPRLLVLPC